ncbi:MAG: N-acetylglucosamine kinase [marine bacterium B5-7]|nr:MAG: N-acetylglucosamine kinase [marine bacterium B5-7]
MRIGIDLGGTKTEGILMDDAGRIVNTIRRPTPAHAGYQAIMEVIVDIVAQLDKIAGTRCRVGIGTPGSLSAVSGHLINSNTTCLNGQAISRDLAERLDRIIRIENDANCFTLSEAIDGAGRDGEIVFGIIMGTGVGGGIVIRRQLIKGAHHIAGEWGHNTLLEDGPACYCGRRGCVETLLSGPAVANAMMHKSGIKPASTKAVFDAANYGDHIAQICVDEFLDYFGRAVAGVVNIIDPHVIVIGGGLSNVDLLYSRGPDAVSRYAFTDRFQTPIVRNRHGDSSGVRGAAWLWAPGE